MTDHDSVPHRNVEPAPKAPDDSPGDARAAAAHARFAQLANMHAQLQFHLFWLNHAIAHLEDRDARDAIKSDADDVVTAASELRDFVHRLVDVRAGEDLPE